VHSFKPKVEGENKIISGFIAINYLLRNNGKNYQK
jgi:hypothetical protein